MCRLGRMIFKVLAVVFFMVVVQAKVGPRFIKTPKKEYIAYQGDSIKLRCAVTGTEDPIHNRTLTAWKKFGGKGNGVIRKTKSWKRFRVKNGRFLRIRKVKLEDSGTYLCVAKNPHGAVTAVIKLTVKASDIPATNSTLSDVTTKKSTTTAITRAPTFQNDGRIKAFKISTGDKLKLRCQVSGDPSPSIYWRKNNKRLSGSTGIHRRRITKWALRFSRVTPSDSGIYQCFASNPYGNITKTFIVQVKGRRVDGKSFSPAPVQRKPVIQEDLLKNVTVSVGDRVTLTCTALSTLVPRFTWLKWTILNVTSNETVKITFMNASDPNVKFILESTRWSGDNISYCHKLQIFNVSEADQGRYTCVVGSNVGFVSSDVYLTVRSKVTNNIKQEKPKGSSSSSHITMFELQIPIAALIGVPVAIGVILIVAIIWCYIETVKHRKKFKMNSQSLVCPNGLARTNSNGLYHEMPRTRNNGVVTETRMPEDTNVHDSNDGTSRGSIPLENPNYLKFNNQSRLQNPSNGDTLLDQHKRCSHNNERIRSADNSLNLEGSSESRANQTDSDEYSEQSNLEEHQEYPGDTTNTNSNRNDILRNCEEQDSCNESNFIRNSVV